MSNSEDPNGVSGRKNVSDLGIRGEILCRVNEATPVYAGKVSQFSGVPILGSRTRLVWNFRAAPGMVTWPRRSCREAVLAVLLLLALSVNSVASQTTPIKSLEVLLLDSPPFTCNDQVYAEWCAMASTGHQLRTFTDASYCQFPCSSLDRPTGVNWVGCQPGSRRTKNGVCVHGIALRPAALTACVPQWGTLANHAFVAHHAFLLSWIHPTDWMHLCKG